MSVVTPMVAGYPGQHRNCRRGVLGARQSSAETMRASFAELAHPHCWPMTVADLPIPELVEQRRRSVAMLAPDTRALNRDEALQLLAQSAEALRRLRRLENAAR
jgi:hypothetical protein